MNLNSLYERVCRSTFQRSTQCTYDAYLVGYYGMQNSGDDALLLASLMGASQWLDFNKLIVSTTNPELATHFGCDLNVLESNQAYRGQNRLKHYSAAFKSNRIIFGGGSVFHSESDIYLKRQMLELSNPELSMALGVSIGPFVNKKAEQQCQCFLNECGYVGVRDQQSYQIARQLAPDVNVSLTFDLAPMLTLSDKFPNRKETSKGVLINVCPTPVDAFGSVDKDKHRRLLEKFSEVIEKVWGAVGVPITLISLNGHSELGDDRLCKELMAQFDGVLPLHFLPYQADPMAMLQSITGYEVFLSMRLHGCIFGYLTGTPVLAMNYHPKCDQWCEQIGLPHQHRFDVSTFSPQQLVDTLVEGVTFGFTRPVLAINDAVKLSLSNWSNAL